MPKKDLSTGESIISESGNWNVASDFAKIKIMLPLTKCEYYEDIATFGYESIIEELNGQQISNGLVRFTGFKRLVNELLRVCKNSKFAMKKTGTKAELEGYETKLEQIKKILPLLVDVKKNNVNKTKELIINGEFIKTLAIVVEIKSSINVPLNQNHLIFTDKEEFNPHEYKKSLKERMIERG